jgi:hypothetical protein
MESTNKSSSYQDIKKFNILSKLYIMNVNITGIHDNTVIVDNYLFENVRLLQTGLSSLSDTLFNAVEGLPNQYANLSVFAILSNDYTLHKENSISDLTNLTNELIRSSLVLISGIVFVTSAMLLGLVIRTASMRALVEWVTCCLGHRTRFSPADGEAEKKGGGVGMLRSAQPRGLRPTCHCLGAWNLAIGLVPGDSLCISSFSQASQITT